MKLKIANLVFWTVIFFWSSVVLLLVGALGYHIWQEIASPDRGHREAGWFLLVMFLFFAHVFAFIWAVEVRNKGVPLL